MRILHVIHSANPAGGGPIEAVKQLATIHRAAGHRVEVATLDPPSAPWVVESAFRVHALGRSHSSFGYTARLIPWMRQRRGDFDIVVSHGLWQFNGLATWSSLRGTGTPFCVFPHGMLDPWFKHRYPLKHLRKWLYWLAAEYWVLRAADGVLFTCEEERIQARRSFELYRCHEIVTSFGTARPPGDPQRQKAQFLERFPHLVGQRLILFLGRVHEKKGCRELIEAFLRVCEKGAAQGTSPVHLVMGGPADHAYGGALQDATSRSRFGDRVTWTGMLGGDLKWGAFHAAEAFILPSHQENFGIAVAEALSCGVPVLISNKVNIWREIEQDGAGLIDSDDEEGTMRLLTRWLGLTPDERARLQEAAPRSFASRFEITKAAGDLLQTFEHLVEAKKRRGAAVEKNSDRAVI